MQGKRIELKVHLSDYTIPPRKPRGKIGLFSRRSRMRMLKMIASIDWPSVKHGLFISLTYPDSALPRPARIRNRDRYLFTRYMENYLHREIPLVWRLEWVERKTGKFRGKFVPHFHLITFAGRFIPHDEVRRWWRTITHERGPLCTDIDKLDSEKKHGLYVAKYAAKLPDYSSLDKGSYLNIGGRHYGYQRKGEIPMAESVAFVDLSWAFVGEIAKLVPPRQFAYDPTIDGGCTFLGELATSVRAKIWRLAIDDGCVPVYDTPIKGERSGKRRQASH